MLTKNFSSVLKNDTFRHITGQNVQQPVKWLEFKKSKRAKATMEHAGFDQQVDDSIQVEANFTIKKIVGYGSSSTVFKAFVYDSVD